jgi:hypothetical protein
VQAHTPAALVSLVKFFISTNLACSTPTADQKRSNRFLKLYEVQNCLELSFIATVKSAQQNDFVQLRTKGEWNV